MSITWLAADDAHPVRPDVAVFRHLSYTEVHAIELGIYLGLLAFYALGYGYGGEMVTLLVGITRFAISDGKSKTQAKPPTATRGRRAIHRLGFHDVREEPQYFGAGFLLGLGTLVVGSTAWDLLGGLGGLAI